MRKTAERRSVVARAEVREAGDQRTLIGRAVTYNTWSELLYDHFREQIAPGAFDESLSREGRDIYASVNHDPNLLLGRESAGTLRVNKDPEGLTVEIPLPDYTYARDLATAIKRGDMRGMSFIFDVTEDKWESRDGVPHRTVTKAEIYEVSYVYFPAYPDGTAVGMRGAPLALPIEGEKRALERMYQCLVAPKLAARRRVLDLLRY